MQKSKGENLHGSRDRLRECAEIWSKLSVEEKQHYKDLLNKDLQQYLADVELFKQVFIHTLHVYKCLGLLRINALTSQLL